MTGRRRGRHYATKENMSLSYRDMQHDLSTTMNTLLLFYSATQTALMPMPVPTHMDVLPTFLPVRFSS